VSAFDNYLQHPSNRQQLSFELRDGGYDVYDHQAPKSEELMPRERMRDAGWRYRRYRAMIDQQIRAQRAQAETLAAQQKATAAPDSEGEPAPNRDPFAQGNAKNGAAQGRDFDPAIEQHTGLILGMSVCSFRAPDGSDQFFNIPGDDVRVSFPKASLPPEAISEFYTIVDFYESKMSEYDSSFALVPLRHLQKSRGMIDPTTGVARFNSIQIKLKPGVDPNVIRDKLQKAYETDARLFLVSTWQDKQGALLAAVAWETRVLNLLLFMIIAVAGFGIFAIFCMIVVEKTRDIGILKSLGASAWGILGIFLAYGLSLGLVGAGLGTALGFWVVANLNELTALISWLLGCPIIDPNIYYFNNLQTYVRPWTVAWIVAGAVVIAVMSSIMPAVRAARLHPVRALRFE
jgi:lipoprotein-releasing system permease protein